MAIRVAINHKTEYRYDRLVSLSPHVVRLRPAPHSRTPVLSYSLKIEPSQHFINWQQDPFGNYLARLVFPERTRRLSFEVDVVTEMTVINPFDFFLEDYANAWPFRYEAQLARELAPYLEQRESGPRLEGWLGNVERRATPSVDFLVDLNRRLQQEIAYVVRMEPGIQSCEETLEKARGSCRDSGWLLVQILRHLGLAARFVSGYLVQLAPDLKPIEGPAGPTQDFTDLHAWAEVYLPGAGWIGLDPTSGLFAGEGHIPLACTPDPQSAAPVTGFAGPAECEFYFHNRVQRIHEDPRVTKPYTEEQWQSIMALGQAVDRDLEGQDVRLTMGGEPTFVSVDDMDGEEWNTGALGEHKRERAEELLRRLRGRFGPGGLLHYGQGKWYPGEPLPRWALSLLWRVDDKPLWRDEALLADPTAEGGVGTDAPAHFMQALTRRLGLSPDRVVPGYEDPQYLLWKEAALPADVALDSPALKDPMERRRLVRLLDEGRAAAPVGYALPLWWREEGEGAGRWMSSAWEFRRGRMYLLPGDSPMGLRLPLDSLPWTPPEKRELRHERDPFDPRAPLASLSAAMPVPVWEHPGLHEQTPEEGAPAADYVAHTALCAELRGGHLHVFLPPLTHLEQFLELLAAIEASAGELDLSLVLEGYEPPRDPRLRKLQVTPDPGVIEVNIHPAHDWEELVANTTVLYEEARNARLGTEKFMMDGRHTGTGGGNHVTLGGATPADSPVLRRPELLQSLLSFWQHHPSLSYLFSGLFIGPTSQAPRVDEARMDSLHELEIAFAQIPRGEVPSPWLVDRLFRHLLIDLTGNTHRAEFCIDKLYSPDTPAGRLGLVEFRAFEMPPHARMSAVQMLLLRALVAWFWRRPYRHRLVRWGTALHDRFMLPEFVWLDFLQVLGELGDAGYRLQPEWFAPFLEFRFPHYGAIVRQGIELDLRFAIEPWHVLGEETTAQGTARFVDSSVERLQARVRGLSPDRYWVSCNGRPLPLQSTGETGSYVAGVRFKAWQPPSGLHPTIAVQAPLIFDIVDRANRRSIGGCTYHVAHPGGRNYETFPVNANEAEARRIARFMAHGHSPGTLDLEPEAVSPEYPCTLDLRYPG